MTFMIVVILLRTDDNDDGYYDDGYFDDPYFNHDYYDDDGGC